MAFKWGKMKSSAKGNGKARKSLKLNPVMCKGHDRPPQGTTIHIHEVEGVVKALLSIRLISLSTPFGHILIKF